MRPIQKIKALNIWLIPLLTIIPLAELAAQNGGFAAAYTRMGFGPRGMAMGNAMTAVTSQGIYPHYNPALAAERRQGIQIDLASALMPFDRTLHQLNGSLSLPPTAGISFSLANANVTGIDGRTLSGYHTRELSTHEFQLMTAFGIRAGKHVYLGTAVKYHWADFHRELSAASGVGLDFGMLFQLHKNLNLGLAVKDLLASYTWDTGNLYNLEGSRDVTNHFPTRLLAGVSYRINRDWTLAANYEFRIQKSRVVQSSVELISGQPRLTTSTRSIRTNSQQLRVGSSYRLHRRFTLRTGWQFEELDRPEKSGHISAGFSIHLPFDKLHPAVDYAFVREPTGISNFHVFALRFNL